MAFTIFTDSRLYDLVSKPIPIPTFPLKGKEHFIPIPTFPLKGKEHFIPIPAFPLEGEGATRHSRLLRPCGLFDSHFVTFVTTVTGLPLEGEGAVSDDSGLKTKNQDSPQGDHQVVRAFSHTSFSTITGLAPLTFVVVEVP